MSKDEMRFSEPAKKVWGAWMEKSSEWGEIYSSVVLETSGYEAKIDGEKGERRRIGRERGEAR